MLFLDGGVVLLKERRTEFVGFTTATYMGDLGGYIGANQKCHAEFPGSYFCQGSEYEQSNTSVAPPASGAWIDNLPDSNGYHSFASCRYDGTNIAWTYAGNAISASSRTGGIVRPAGPLPSTLCSEQKPLACCRRASSVIFRGFTTATYQGNLGGYMGANQKCHAEFPGSYFCQGSEYEQANAPIAPPATGAWIDNLADSYGYRSFASCRYDGTNIAWTSIDVSVSASSRTGAIVRPAGPLPSTLCNEVKPLACCSR